MLCKMLLCSSQRPAVSEGRSRLCCSPSGSGLKAGLLQQSRHQQVFKVSSIRSLKDLQATAVDSILIPWFAFQNHSVLAAEALVETVVALYRSGWSVERIQMELSFLTLQRQRAGMDQVQSIDSEMLLSFVLLIMITAKETGCPLYPSVSASGQEQTPNAPAQDSAQARQVQGLMQYTRQTLQQYTNGATLRGMTTKQERALKNMHSSSSAANTELPGVSGEQKISPQMLYMQNLTRIVLLTIESLQQQGLVPPRSVLIPQMRQSFGMAEAGAVPQNIAPSARKHPTGFASHLNPSTSRELSHEALLGSSASPTAAQARWMAVTMLLCFMGATLGWSISWQLFVDAALLAYLSGVTAQQLYDQLLPKEFSQAGEILKAVSSATVAAEKINAEAFARWVSVAYMTWAQLGLRHPLSGVEEGWAWVNIDGVGEGRDGVAAHAMSDFVARTLVQLEAEAGVERAADETTTQDSRPLDGANRTLPSVIKQNPQLDASLLATRVEQARSDTIQKLVDSGHVMTKIADSSLAKTSSAMRYMLQQNSVVLLAKQAASTLSP